MTLSTDQRTRIRQTVFARGNVPRVDRVDFALRAGTIVPTTVRVVEVDDVLIDIYPEWRGHMYFVVRDDIVIVDRSRHVIAVVPTGTGASGALRRPFTRRGPRR